MSEAEKKVDLSYCPSPHLLKNRIIRVIWGAVWLFLFRPTPRTFFFWRNFLLRVFGAKLGHNVHVYPSAKIWLPSNLTMMDNSCLADYVDCYCVAPVTLEDNATVSQHSVLCTAGHDVTTPNMTLTTCPVTLKSQSWVTSYVFVGPGVTVGEGAVLSAGAVVMKSIPDWEIWGGNPAVFIKRREVCGE